MNREVHVVYLGEKPRKDLPALALNSSVSDACRSAGRLYSSLREAAQLPEFKGATPSMVVMHYSDHGTEGDLILAQKMCCAGPGCSLDLRRSQTAESYFGPEAGKIEEMLGSRDGAPSVLVVQVGKGEPGVTNVVDHLRQRYSVREHDLTSNLVNA